MWDRLKCMFGYHRFVRFSSKKVGTQFRDDTEVSFYEPGQIEDVYYEQYICAHCPAEHAAFTDHKGNPLKFNNSFRER